MPTIKIKPKLNINATLKVPGDKSITHRSVIFAGLAQGHCTVYDYLDGDDCRRTIEAFRQCGIEIKKDKTQLYIEGKGLNGLKAPEIPINAGNSGTTIRLLSGVFAGQNFETEMFGDASLSKRPMKRVMEPLGLMGVKIQAANSQYPPLKITGNPDLKPITYNLPIASAQVKSAVLLAGLQAHGKTTVIEPGLSRDHTERLLEYFGAKIKYKNNIVTVEGKAELKAKDIYVPGDFSSAAFFIAAGLLAKKSKIKIENFKIVCNEPVGDIVAEVSSLKGITLDTALVPQLIDEIPLLVLIASQAQGKTVIKGAGELRVKESDRIKAISSELKKMGAVITELEDGFIVDGPVKLHGAIVESYDDHRIAMTTAIAGLCADGETEINNSECVDISFPNFWELIEKI